MTARLKDMATGGIVRVRNQNQQQQKHYLFNFIYHKCPK